MTYERNFYTQHLQLQVIAIPASRSDDVKDTFLDFAEENSMAFQTMAEDEDISQVIVQLVTFLLSQWERVPDSYTLRLNSKRLSI